jgi:MoxR-like ATPase
MGSTGTMSDEIESAPALGSPAAVRAALAAAGYLADDHTAAVAHLAEELGKPVLVEGPAGTGKTALAKAVAAISGRRLIRLQCYEGLDESRALFEWNYRKQLMRLQERALRDDPRASDDGDLFAEEYLLARPLLEAIRSPEAVVLLVDEVDRLDIETEALLLEVLAEHQVSIPELGTVTATCEPTVYLTSNNTRELSEALKRRCLYLHLGYPSADREREILLHAVPDLPEHIAGRVAVLLADIRGRELRKAPSISEAIDWARALVVMGVEDVGHASVGDWLHVLLKSQHDIELVRRELVERAAP